MFQNKVVKFSEKMIQNVMNFNIFLSVLGVGLN
jgi:hypothetical protein